MTSRRRFWSSILNRRMLLCVFTGFSSGMPLYVLYQLVPAWLRDEGVDLATIGLFSLVSFPYTWKFLWSPLMDRFAPPGLGRRRGWSLATQVALLLALAAFGWTDPARGVRAIAVLAFLTAFASASQDIALDAWRRDLLPDRELGIGNAFFVNAYRLSSLVPGSLALILADRLPWRAVHLVVAGFMLVGILTTLIAAEPPGGEGAPTTLRAAVVEPFVAFVRRNGGRRALAVLAFMLLYKLGDSMATALSTPFYLDLGFTKTTIGTVAKAAALWSSIAGGFVGGAIIVRAGIHRSLWLFGVVQLVSILGYAALARIGADPAALFAVVSFEYLGVGLGTAAFIAFIARSTDRRYTATQLALLTSLTGVPRTFANATTGFLVEAMGYEHFFYLCALVALPGMLMLPLVAPWGDDPPEEAPPAGDGKARGAAAGSAG